MFDWRRFFDSNGIEWRESGPNIARGNLGICCPFCGQNDNSFHLGINLKNPGEFWVWNCWKDPTHRGRTPYYLIQKIAKCSRADAIALYDGAFSVQASLYELEEQLANLGKSEGTSLENTGFSLDEFRLSPTDVDSTAFYDYLHENRGFPDPVDVADKYQLRGAISGQFVNRLIFPFYIGGTLVGWTGRHIGDHELRYKTEPSGKGMGSRLLYNYDAAQATGGRVLALCEGPVDALKLDYYGAARGLRAVAILGLKLTGPKTTLLVNLSSKFEKLVIVLDRGTQDKALELSRTLSFLSPKIFDLEIAKDPGALTEDQTKQLIPTLLDS